MLGAGLLTGCASPVASPSPSAPVAPSTANPSATVAPSSPAAGATPPPDGLIAFARTTFDPATRQPTGGDIWSVTTDGSDLRSS